MVSSAEAWPRWQRLIALGLLLLVAKPWQAALACHRIQVCASPSLWEGV